MAPVHPGEILREGFMEPLCMTPQQLARALGVPADRIEDVVTAKRAMNVEIASLLARFFGTTERFWLNLQARYDLEVEKDKGA